MKNRAGASNATQRIGKRGKKKRRKRKGAGFGGVLRKDPEPWGN